jgi:amino acid adenylation domain-containing protein
LEFSGGHSGFSRCLGAVGGIGLAYASVRNEGHISNAAAAVLSHQAPAARTIRVGPPLAQSKSMTEPREIPANRLEAAFAAQAARTPGIEAVRMGDRVLTYAEIEAASGKLAAEFAERGAAGGIVALRLARGPEQLIAMLAALRAGATVMPLDPAYPDSLTETMLNNAPPTLIVDAAGTRSRLAKSGNGSLCYILHTSGSTGQPKAVAMPHRAIVNLVDWHRRTLPLKTGTRVLQFAPLTFDVSFQEIFSTWADGGTLVLVDETTRVDPAALWRLIASEKIERIFLPYVALQTLAEAAPADLPSALREVITAGEQLRITPQIRSLFTRLPGSRLHNHYGPTESHVCTAYTLPGSPASWPLLPPIGSAIDNVQTRLVEDELYVGGICLAEGYLGRPDLTAGRFVQIDGKRFYKTGDLARESADGTFEYLGRTDDQLKVRGFRIEPGEIEAHLSQHPAVRECAVTARDQRLLAYWTGDAADPAELRDFLAGRLAAQFVPSIFTRLETMPLTGSGKINRRALPDPAPTVVPELVPMDSAMAEEIARVWSDLLHIAVLPDANFFDLGGTSITAATAQRLLGEALGRELPVVMLFENPTVVALARRLEGRQENSLAQRTQARAAAQRAALAQRHAHA